MLCAKELWGTVLCYLPKCIKRCCPTCADALKSRTCAACRAVNPEITYEKWSDTEYPCVDGRTLTVKDFVSTSVPIDTFMTAWHEFNATFFQHHNRAMFMDAKWKNLWENISDGVPPRKEGEKRRARVGIVMDFSKSCWHRGSYTYADIFKAQGKPPKPRYQEVQVIVDGVPLKVGTIGSTQPPSCFT